MEHPRYTVKDWEQWKEDWELIDGYPYTLLPSPVADHNRIVNRALTIFLNQLSGKINCACEVFTELDWRVDAFTVFRPDLAVVCNGVVKDYIQSPPSLILEVSSPSTAERDKKIKKTLYAAEGVKYYLIADLKQRQLQAFELRNGVYEATTSTDFAVSETCQFSLDAEALFATMK